MTAFYTKNAKGKTEFKTLHAKGNVRAVSPTSKAYGNTMDYDLKTAYGEKVYKITLDGGMTCPNRDGTKGTRGCIFCSRGGSGDFAENHLLSVSEQIASGQKKLAAKTKCRKFIAYFQAYTNTYAPVSYLRPLFLEAIRHPDIVVLSIATKTGLYQ